MSNYLTNDTELTQIADAIRSKTGNSGQISYPSGFVTEINNLSASASEFPSNYDIIVTHSGNSINSTISSALITSLEWSDIDEDVIFASLPAVTAMGAGTFMNYDKLAFISIPLVTSIDDGTFEGCSKLVTLSIPLATSIGYLTFHDCSNLTTISIPLTTSIDDYAFEGCSNLTTIVLGANQVCTLGSGAIPSEATVYVPDDLVNSYKSATNWSDIASQIKGISEMST